MSFEHCDICGERWVVHAPAQCSADRLQPISYEAWLALGAEKAAEYIAVRMDLSAYRQEKLALILKTWWKESPQSPGSTTSGDYAPLSDTPPTNIYINVKWGDEYGRAQYTGGNPLTAQWYKSSANQFSHGAPCATPDTWWKARRANP